MTAERDLDTREMSMRAPGLAIRHLAALVAVAAESSPSAAASNLGCTEKVLTRHLSELEVAMGVPLVVHARGDERLTEGGRRMLPHAEAVLGRVEAARSELAAK